MSSTVHLDILKEIRIAAPCTAAWEDMAGDHRKRHCAQCDLDVHNFAEMSREEIERLALGANGRVCGRLFRRADGTILTRDCPVGLAAIRAKARRTAARVVAFASVLFSATVLFAAGKEDPWNEGKLIRYQPFRWAYEKLGPQFAQSMPAVPGEICVSPPPTNSPTPGSTTP